MTNRGWKGRRQIPILPENDAEDAGRRGGAGGWDRGAESVFLGRRVKPLPWREDVFRDDLRTYAERGVRHVTSFAAWVDGDYVRRFGDPPLEEYGAGFRRWRIANGRALPS